MAFQVKIPSTIRKRTTDTVRYSTSSGDESADVCYSRHMGKLCTTEFWLKPDTKERDRAVNRLTFLRWIKLLQSHRIVPRGVKATHENGGNILHIPKKGYSRHSVYAALCAYRCAESFAPMVYSILYLLKKRPELSFWQVFHYGVSQFGPTIGHNWYYAMPSIKAHVTMNYGGPFNLGMLVAAIFFWHRREDQKKGTGYTCDAIKVFCDQFAPCQSQNGYSYPSMVWNATTENRNDGQSDVLDPCWTPFLKFVEDQAMLQPTRISAALAKEIRSRYEDIPQSKIDQEIPRTIISTNVKKYSIGAY